MHLIPLCMEEEEEERGDARSDDFSPLFLLLLCTRLLS